MNKICLLFIILLSIISSVNSQDSNTGIYIGYEQLRGEDYYIFKPAVSINYEYESEGFLVGLGYMKFKPVSDTFFYIDTTSITGYGQVSFEDHYVVPIYLGYIKFIEVNEKFSVKPGFQGAYFLSYYAYNGNTSVGRFGASARFGATYNLSEKFYLNIIIKYTGMFDLDGGYMEEGAYTPSFFHHYLTIGGGLSYVF
ncbi:MAG: hypothetical protein A2W91_05370 [Bacteroidetes bacterium GWF2_38_335]|nr:MAG: hypothetical protein A2W91_05370 [Bacteroidetes bacterium GWF2_38_335]HBS88127.1 hypothetical protein [Bacteroidales bacterium]